MSINFENLIKIRDSLGSLNVTKAPKVIARKFTPPPPIQSDKFIKSTQKEIPQIIKSDISDEYLQALSEKLHNSAEQTFSEYYKYFQSVFGDTGAEFTGRIKEISSIFSKLQKRAERLNQCDVSSLVPDLYGYKLITNGSPEEIEKIVSRIEDMVASETVIPSHFLNHGELSYLDKKQVKGLERMGFFASPNAKKSGFTDVNMYFRDASNKNTFELQIIGDKSNQVNLKEHLFYNFKTKGAATEHGVVNKKMQAIFESMTDLQKEVYEEYVNKCYAYARKLELGEQTQKPLLPEGLNKALELV